MRAARALTIAVGVLIGASAVGLRAQTISDAEQRLFLDDHLSNVGAAATLRYRHQHAGSLEPGFEGPVVVTLASSDSGRGKRVHVDYLTGQRAFTLPDVNEASGNPVILFFLERDVREMQRLTGGHAQYFRKRVRLALAEAASVEPIALAIEGRNVPAVRIRIAPFEDDPMKRRYEALSAKSYTFVLCDEVPGEVYEIRSEVLDTRPPMNAGDDRPALIEETLTFAGAGPP